MPPGENNNGATLPASQLEQGGTWRHWSSSMIIKIDKSTYLFIFNHVHKFVCLWGTPVTHYKHFYERYCIAWFIISSAITMQFKNKYLVGLTPKFLNCIVYLTMPCKQFYDIIHLLFLLFAFNIITALHIFFGYFILFK